jgi:tetratricopeptide (TPR) repeat protein
VSALGELIDRGIKAYLAGRVAEARRAFDEVLGTDPGNARARSYLVLLDGGLGGTPAPERARPAPARPAPAAPSRPAPPPAPATAAPVAAAPAPAPARAAVRAEEYAPSPWDDGPAAPATFVLDPSGGLDLNAVSEKSDLRPLVPDAPRAPPVAPAARNDVNVWMQAARELHALGDFTGSLELIEKILQLDGGHAEAREYLRQNESTLVAMYESKLGPLTAVPRLAIKPEEILWLNLDHRAGFLLAQIDGAIDYDSLFALSGLPRLDTAKILATLIQDGVIRS